MAAACPALTTLVVYGAVGRAAGRAVDARALPRLTHLSWTTTGDGPLHGDPTPLLAGRALDAATLGRHVRRGGPAPVVDPVVAALNAAAALPVELDLVTAGPFTDATLRRAVDASRGVVRVERLRLALDAGVTADGLAALGRLPALASLCVHVADERAARLFRAWPWRRPGRYDAGGRAAAGAAAAAAGGARRVAGRGDARLARVDGQRGRRGAVGRVARPPATPAVCVRRAGRRRGRGGTPRGRRRRRGGGAHGQLDAGAAAAGGGRAGRPRALGGVRPGG